MIAKRAHVAEQILDQTLRSWRSESSAATLGRRWSTLRALAARALASLRREAELAEKFADNSPQMGASGLHPWVWELARALWQGRNYQAALHAAASSLTSEAQAKSGRFDVADRALFEQTFSLSAPTPGKPRLRVIPDDGKQT